MALPHDLQLHGGLSARHRHHARHPGGLRRHRGPSHLSPASGDAGGLRRVLIRADGAARGNPGPASAGAVIIDADRPGANDPDATPVAVIARPLGVRTNNYAEWTAVLLGLERAAELGATEVELVLDSKLVVEQLAGRWRVKQPALITLHRQSQTVLKGFSRWSARHEGRASNRAADALANLALDDPAAARRAESASVAEVQAGSWSAPPNASDPDPEAWICATCGVQYPLALEPPAACPICEDDR
ncbi:MAG: reverse transcriptase-like protein, partial [Chloroflexota bacterium]|nr:reverse transcriptase-like protein [Chloroflexota bacterium]